MCFCIKVIFLSCIPASRVMKEEGKSFLMRINAKERQAFRELFAKHYRPLVMFAMHYLGGQEESEDVVQDLFVAVWEKKEAFLSEQSIQAFLYNSVRNTCLNLLKHRKVEEKYLNYSQQDINLKEEEDEYKVLEEELYERLFRIIDELPPRCREIFLLHLDGKKNEEIANQLNISLLTVKTQKKKAMSHLRKRMGIAVIVLLGLCVQSW